MPGGVPPGQPVSGSVPVRYWSLAFALAAVFAVGAFVYAPFAADWWLPKAPPASWQADTPGEAYHTVSAIGREVDHLFIIILWITGITFVGTQVALVYVAWKYVDGPGRVATYFHGSQRLEVIWTIIPAAILVFIALYQMGAWADIKFRSSMPKIQPLAEVTARQFQWVIRYAGPDGKLRTPDDLFAVNDLHFVKDKKALINLRSGDV